MAMPNNDPIVVLDVCPKHKPRGVDVVRVGKEGSAGANDRIIDMLSCGDCWRKDESGLLALMAEFNFSPGDVAIVRKHALRKKRGQE